MENSGIYARRILGIYMFVLSEQREIISLNTYLLVSGLSCGIKTELLMDLGDFRPKFVFNLNWPYILSNRLLQGD